ncbi:hypothetical protein OVA06_08820 [Pseudarthrobacter sp. SL88]|uniref:hypothetical protein n=1 Tax=Micrococcaceae TaxID=1268 RepID=UPI0021BF2F49|nr:MULTISPECIES: hypothetical protein [Micrococcaceae]MCY1674808.1 hypothetical protein [Pseudarthrobacter sp. SL88]MDQ1056030.1 hypothetical protein [Arthrobacter sp. SORGH_AS_0212]
MEIVVFVVLPLVFFYILYGVIRAAVRDGILAADRVRSAGSIEEAGALEVAEQREP